MTLPKARAAPRASSEADPPARATGGARSLEGAGSQGLAGGGGALSWVGGGVKAL